MIYEGINVPENWVSALKKKKQLTSAWPTRIPKENLDREHFKAKLLFEVSISNLNKMMMGFTSDLSLRGSSFMDSIDSAGLLDIFNNSHEFGNR